MGRIELHAVKHDHWNEQQKQWKNNQKSRTEQDTRWKEWFKMHANVSERQRKEKNSSYISEYNIIYGQQFTFLLMLSVYCNIAYRSKHFNRFKHSTTAHTIQINPKRTK